MALLEEVVEDPLAAGLSTAPLEEVVQDPLAAGLSTAPLEEIVEDPLAAGLSTAPLEEIVEDPLAAGLAIEESSTPLLEELVEEVLIRFPPAEPESLVLASLVCKQWYAIISAPDFRRRFREFHRSPPMLGFVINSRDTDGDYISRLVSTSRVCPRHDDHINWRALDARHGRVLLGCVIGTGGLVVWDPIAYGRHVLPPVLADNAGVLCAAGDDCDHLDCQGGPFIVVALGSGPKDLWIRVYSSDAGFWSKPVFVSPAPKFGVRCRPPALVKNTIYFSIDASCSILKYSLVSSQTSIMNLPSEACGCATTIIAMEQDRLAVAKLDGATAILSVWSIQESANGQNGWTKIRIVDLQKLLGVDALPISSLFIAFAYGIRVLLVEAAEGIFSVDLECGKGVMVYKGNGFYGVVPYMSFYTPESIPRLDN